MSLISSHDYHRRRAQRVLHLLHGLWGEDLPAGPDPELTVLIDAVAGDDHLGSQDGYVVQSDRLTYEALALLLRRCSTPAVAARALPRELLSRVFAASTPPELETPDPTHHGLDGGHDGRHDGCDVHGFADPYQAVGTWHLDGEQQLLSWDETSAALLERQDAPRCIEVMEEVEVWTHPEDRAAVAEGWQRCIQTAVPHQARFRVVRPRGGYIPCFSGGRRIVDAAGKVHVVGFLQHDEPARGQPR